MDNNRLVNKIFERRFNIMDMHSVHQLMQTKSIYEIPLCVTFYACVSSEMDQQLNSLNNHISYYRNFRKKNVN